MKVYDKEKLHEYAKELFALCLEKGISFINKKGFITIEIASNAIYTTFLTKGMFNFGYENNTLPIWELIEKVKQL